MLPIENRLKDRRDFAQVYEKGNFVSAAGLTIRFVPNALPVSRLGFPVGKNFSKSAVVRNRIRRRLRAASRAQLPKIFPGFDLVISYAAKDKNPGLAEISAKLEKLLLRAHLKK